MTNNWECEEGPEQNLEEQILEGYVFESSPNEVTLDETILRTLNNGNVGQYFGHATLHFFNGSAHQILVEYVIFMHEGSSKLCVKTLDVGLNHKTVKLIEPETEEEIDIDEKIAPLIQKLWNRGIKTFSSCQSNTIHQCWISFNCEKPFFTFITTVLKKSKCSMQIVRPGKKKK